MWAAGVKAPDVLKDIAGLETNRAQPARGRGRHCRPRATTTSSPSATAPPARGLDITGTVPPRAQAAHQQASHLAKQLPRRIAGKPLREWHYRDFGSLVSLGHYSTVGNLMGKLIGGNLFIEGLFAGLDVQVALQDAPARAARTHEGGARHNRTSDHPAHRAAGQAALR